MPFDSSIYADLRAGKSGFIHLAHRALWKLTGTDRVRYLNGQTTNDIAKLTSGHALYAAVTTAKGRMEGDIFVSASTDALWLDAAIELRETLGPRLEKYIIADDALLEDVTDTYQLTHVFGAAPPQAPPQYVVFSNPRFGLPGHDVWHPSGVVAQMGSPVPDELVEVLRIEHGLPRWGADMNTDTLPPEAGLDRNGISYTKGCYIGQETIARIKSIGHVNKHLVCLASPDATFAAPGTEIVAEGKPVGKVTSGVFSPALGKGLVLGYVPRALAQPGKNLEIAGTIYTIVPAPLTPTI